jgi:hypothetical protein
VEKLNFKKVNDRKVREQYQVKISNKFAALEYLIVDDVDIIKAWQSTTESIQQFKTQRV